MRAINIITGPIMRVVTNEDGFCAAADIYVHDESGNYSENMRANHVNSRQSERVQVFVEHPDGGGPEHANDFF